MWTLTSLIIAMLVGYYLGTKETDKKWTVKKKINLKCSEHIEFLQVTFSDGSTKKVKLEDLD